MPFATSEDARGNENDEASWQMEPARQDDVPALIELMGSVVPDCAPQTVWELPWNWHNYRVLRHKQGDIIAAGSLQDVDEQRVELRGIVVRSTWRGSGIASKLLQMLLRQAQEDGKTPFCITGKPDFFARFGFAHNDAVRRRDWPRERPDRAPGQRLTMQLCPQEASYA